MKFKNVKEKIRFIDSLDYENNQTILNLISILSHLSQDKNTDVRESLAKQLVMFDGDEIEDILYNMLSDKNRMVRLEALDSLSVGRNPRTIRKVSNMLINEGYLIRMYAVMTLFDLITNFYGLNDIAFEIYRKIITESFINEKNQHVLLAYYQNEYYMQPEYGLSLLRKFYVDAIEYEKYDLIWTMLHIFQDIKNKKNQSILCQILEYKDQKLLLNQKAMMENIRNQNVSWKILVIDEDNTFLSHVVALTLYSMHKNEGVSIFTAGIDVGVVRIKDIKSFCERNDIRVTNKLFSKKITEAYSYDYIVCLNTKLDQGRYSKIKTVYYENINVENDEEIITTCQEIIKELGI